jgi:hypothetical protein
LPAHVRQYLIKRRSEHFLCHEAVGTCGRKVNLQFVWTLAARESRHWGSDGLKRLFKEALKYAPDRGLRNGKDIQMNKKYRTWCGTRSFIFQCCLLGWTIFMVVLLVFILRDAQEETQTYVNKREMSPRDAETFTGVSVCCPCGLWFLVAFPLGMAAILTLKH